MRRDGRWYGRNPCDCKGLRGIGDTRGRTGAERKGFEPLVRSYPRAALAKPRAADECPKDSKGISTDTAPVGISVGINSVAFTPNAELARVVELWPVLPPAIRAAVIALVNAGTPADGKPTAEPDLDRLPPGYERRADRS